MRYLVPPKSPNPKSPEPDNHIPVPLFKSVTVPSDIEPVEAKVTLFLVISVSEISHPAIEPLLAITLPSVVTLNSEDDICKSEPDPYNLKPSGIEPK